MDLDKLDKGEISASLEVFLLLQVDATVLNDATQQKKKKKKQA